MGRKDLKRIVKTYLDEQGVITRFRNNTPGSNWIASFEKRHKEKLSRKRPELLTKARAEGLSVNVVNTFFDLYENLLSELGLQNCPKQIFNLDETGLNTNLIDEKVYAKKGSEPVYQNSATCGKTSYSVMFCCSAAGEYLPPLVVFKGLNLYDTWTKGGPDGAMYAVTESGWMQDIVFESWLFKFVESMRDRPKPILLVFDGHSSHLTYRATKICKENEISMLCLPPHTSHAL